MTAPSSTSTKTAASMASSSPVSQFVSNLRAADTGTMGAMALNFCSSISIVVVNKFVMDKFGFNFAITLTCFHLACTFALLLCTSRLGVFEIKRLPIVQVSKLAAGTMGFICLTNQSLKYNSVGFYQVMKVMTTPTVVLIESLLYQKYLPTRLKVALIPVCVGVMFTAVNDFRLNFVGSVYAVAGVVVTSFYQIWSGTLQKSLDCNALQLQTYVAPLAALFTLPFVPMLDKWNPADAHSIWNFDFNLHRVVVISMTGFIAFLVNVSIFLVIGKSSAVSYNILGHCKTIMVLLSDFILFGRPLTFKSWAGILLTLIGVFWYSSLKLEKARLEKEARERNDSSASLVDLKVDADDDPKERLLNSEQGR